ENRPGTFVQSVPNRYTNVTSPGLTKFLETISSVQGTTKGKPFCGIKIDPEICIISFKVLPLHHTPVISETERAICRHFLRASTGTYGVLGSESGTGNKIGPISRS